MKASDLYICVLFQGILGINQVCQLDLYCYALSTLNVAPLLFFSNVLWKYTVWR